MVPQKITSLYSFFFFNLPIEIPQKNSLGISQPWSWCFMGLLFRVSHIQKNRTNRLGTLDTNLYYSYINLYNYLPYFDGTWYERGWRCLVFLQGIQELPRKKANEAKNNGTCTSNFALRLGDTQMICVGLLCTQINNQRAFGLWGVLLF